MVGCFQVYRWCPRKRGGSLGGGWVYGDLASIVRINSNDMIWGMMVASARRMRRWRMMLGCWSRRSDSNLTTLMVNSMLMTFIPAAFVFGPLVDLRLAARRCWQGSTGNVRCLPCSSGELPAETIPAGGTASLPESSHCQHSASTVMARLQSEALHGGIDLEDDEVHPSHTGLAHPELAARCL